MEEIIKIIQEDTGLPISQIDTLQLFVWIAYKLDKHCTLTPCLRVDYYEHEYDEGSYFCELSKNIMEQSDETIKELQKLIKCD